MLYEFLAFVWFLIQVVELKYYIRFLIFWLYSGGTQRKDGFTQGCLQEGPGERTDLHKTDLENTLVHSMLINLTKDMNVRLNLRKLNIFI